MEPNNRGQVKHTDHENKNDSTRVDFSDQELEMMAEQLLVGLETESKAVESQKYKFDLDKAVQEAVETKTILACDLKDLYDRSPDDRREILGKLYRKGVAFEDVEFGLYGNEKELISVPIDAFLALNYQLKELTLQKHDPYEVYISHIAKIPLLTPEEEVECSRRLFSAESESAILQLFESNLYIVPIVAWFHSKKSKKGTDRMEMIRVGNEALLKAIATFDYTKGYRFETHAICVIDSEFKRKKL